MQINYLCWLYKNMVVSFRLLCLYLVQHISSACAAPNNCKPIFYDIQKNENIGMKPGSCYKSNNVRALSVGSSVKLEITC